MMFCKGEAHSIACVSYSATYGNSVSILQTNPNFYLILFVPAVQDVPFDLQKKYQKKYFGINVFSIVSMSASQFKANARPYRMVHSAAAMLLRFAVSRLIKCNSVCFPFCPFA